MKRAFTLLELLIVVLIIAILLAITGPGLSGARKRAWQAKCLSNQSQIGKAMVMYGGDSRDVVPREAYTPERPCWPVVFRPYMDAREPSGDRFESAPYYADPARPKDNHKVHYVTNGVPFLGPGLVDGGVWRDSSRRRGPTSLFLISLPARTIYLSEFADDPDSYLWDMWDTYGPRDEDLGQFYDVWAHEHIDPADPDLRFCPTRHGNGANALFFDGHAALQLAAQLTDINAWNDMLYLQPR